MPPVAAQTVHDTALLSRLETSLASASSTWRSDVGLPTPSVPAQRDVVPLSALAKRHRQWVPSASLTAL